MIRAGIFFVAGATLLVFPKQLLKWQINTTKRLEKIFPLVKYSYSHSIFRKKYWARTNFVTGIACWIIAVGLLALAVLG